MFGWGRGAPYQLLLMFFVPSFDWSLTRNCGLLLIFVVDLRYVISPVEFFKNCYLVDDSSISGEMSFQYRNFNILNVSLCCNCFENFVRMTKKSFAVEYTSFVVLSISNDVMKRTVTSAHHVWLWVSFWLSSFLSN